MVFRSGDRLCYSTKGVIVLVGPLPHDRGLGSLSWWKQRHDHGGALHADTRDRREPSIHCHLPSVEFGEMVPFLLERTDSTCVPRYRASLQDVCLGHAARNDGKQYRQKIFLHRQQRFSSHLDRCKATIPLDVLRIFFWYVLSPLVFLGFLGHHTVSATWSSSFLLIDTAFWKSSVIEGTSHSWPAAQSVWRSCLGYDLLKLSSIAFHPIASTTRSLNLNLFSTRAQALKFRKFQQEYWRAPQLVRALKNLVFATISVETKKILLYCVEW